MDFRYAEISEMLTENDVLLIFFVLIKLLHYLCKRTKKLLQ